MKLRKFIAVMSAVAISASAMLCTPIYADTPLTRGEAADMLLAAADDYTPDLQRSDIIQGYEDGKLYEDKELTRAEALVMLKRAFGEFPAPKGHNLRSGYPAANFTDVPEWAKTEIADVLASGIVAGTSESTLSPDDVVTDKQLELLIERTYSYMGTNLKDDFWATVNKESLDNTEIPEGKKSAGGLGTIKDNADKQMEALMDELLKGEYEKGTKEQKIADFYRSVLNSQNRKNTGLEPIRPLLERIENAENLEDIMDINNELAKEDLGNDKDIFDENGVCPFIIFYQQTDFNDNSKKALSFEATKGLLRDKDIYEDENIISEYKKLAETYFKAMGKSDEEAEKCASLAVGFEQRTMKHYPTYQQTMDVDYTNNIYLPEEIESMFPTVDIESVFAKSGYDESLRNKGILVPYVDYAKATAAELREDNLETLKAYAEFTVMHKFGPMLSDELFNARQDFYISAGMEAKSSPEQTALTLTETYLTEYMGEMYADKYFSAEKKSNVEDMVKDIIGTYKNRISKLSWMSEKTKEKALLKLDKMRIKVGYPDKTEDILKDAEIQPDSLYENYLTVAKAIRQHNLDTQFDPVNKDKFEMPAFMVNAYYEPQQNEIVFPAAILQAPIYDYEASYETNLGGTGYVIAHEITHAFDNSGAKFDENGSAANWWTEEDLTAFNKLCEKMEAYYENQESAPGITTNGELTLGENIADNGAIACLVEIISNLENPDYDSFFRAAAVLWAESYDRSTLEYYSTIDPHSNAKLRINRVFENNQAFYDTYGIKEGDGMYVAPEDRINIW